MAARLLIVASAAIIFALGALHLRYTFSGPKLRPRDPELEDRLKTALPVITRQTTMWKAWVGFNASHGLGALFFGAVYGYLALAESALLFRSTYLAVIGGLLLGAYVVLAKRYWFSAPFRGVALAAACYAAGFIASLV